jgi:hypothetical protein
MPRGGGKKKPWWFKRRRDRYGATNYQRLMWAIAVRKMLFRLHYTREPIEDEGLKLWAGITHSP